mmetsp:Transcript_98997/g.279682  ORF Transcript_98997/g.279682 Transcript_98997/m.279682 type:complete len:339 (-) Transcript_98997:124-1140(-)
MVTGAPPWLGAQLRRSCARTPRGRSVGRVTPRGPGLGTGASSVERRPIAWLGSRMRRRNMSPPIRTPRWSLRVRALWTSRTMVILSSPCTFFPRARKCLRDGLIVRRAPRGCTRASRRPNGTSTTSPPQGAIVDRHWLSSQRGTALRNRTQHCSCSGFPRAWLMRNAIGTLATQHCFAPGSLLVSKRLRGATPHNCIGAYCVVWSALAPRLRHCHSPMRSHWIAMIRTTCTTCCCGHCQVLRSDAGAWTAAAVARMLLARASIVSGQEEARPETGPRLTLRASRGLRTNQMALKTSASTVARKTQTTWIRMRRSEISLPSSQSVSVARIAQTLTQIRW